MQSDILLKWDFEVEEQFKMLEEFLLDFVDILRWFKVKPEKSWREETELDFNISIIFLQIWTIERLASI